MNLSEILCYLLNYKGRYVFLKSNNLSKNKLDQTFISDYKKKYWMNDDSNLNKYIESGTFLNRYRNSMSYIKKYFDKNFFLDKTVLEIGSGRGPLVLYIASEKKPKFIYGVEINPKFAQFSKTMLKDHKTSNVKILNKDMSSVQEIKNNSIDVILSIASFEHIQNLEAVILESYRVLKPGGFLRSSFSPIWRHYYGSHLSKEIPFPWTHLIFSEPTVRRTLERLQGIPRKGILYSGLNKLTFRDYKKIVVSTPWSSATIFQTTNSKLKKIIINIPIINEYFAGSITMILKK